MAIHIEYETDQKLDVDYEKIIPEVVEAALDFEKCPYEIDVNVVLTDNASIKEINQQYRAIDRPTDVLSFPMIDFLKPADFSVIEEGETDIYFDPDSGELVIGDIIISVEKVCEQAEGYGHSMERELGFLVAHSMLHLFGYDHMEDDERIVMEQHQKNILNTIGLTR